MIMMILDIIIHHFYRYFAPNLEMEYEIIIARRKNLTYIVPLNRGRIYDFSTVVIGQIRYFWFSDFFQKKVDIQNSRTHRLKVPKNKISSPGVVRAVIEKPQT